MWATGAYGYLCDYLVWWTAFASLLVHTCCVARFWPPAVRPRWRLVVGNALVTLTLLGAIALLAESYLRFLSTSTDAFGATLTARRWFYAYPELNSLYFRDSEWAVAKPPGVRRVAFVGDSFTYGWAINDRADRFSDRIQQRFNERSPGRVEVMNLAWLGWDSREELRALDLLIPEYSIDEVVLCYLPNDIEPLLPVSAEFNPTRAPKSRLLNTSTSFLLDYLYHRVWAPHRGTWGAYWDWLADGFENPGVLGQHAATLRAMHAMCQRHSAELRVALIPFIVTRGERYQTRRVHAVVKSVFADLGVPTVDLYDAVTGWPADKLIVNRHDPHPNELAHRLFAEAIWAAFYSAAPGETGGLGSRSGGTD
jgi:lysophospholipase L1-like esterase